MPSPAIQKKALRAQLRHQRGGISSAQHQQFSRDIIRHLTQNPWWAEVQQVFSYVPILGEPDLTGLWEPYPGKIWGLPRRVGQELIWHQWQWGTLLTQGKIPEPYPDAPELTPQPGDFLLIPALAYDHQGYRLGYGGGYFDRLLAQPQWQAVYCIGIVFSQFLLPVLPRAPWDRTVQAVCTEQGWWVIAPPG